MTTKVLVPLLGEGVEEVTISRWLKREGDSIKELEPLLEVNTDKVDTEIPSPAAGTLLKILAQEGVAAKVGATLAVIGKPGESIDTAVATPSASPGAARPASGPPAIAKVASTGVERGGGFIAPVVKRMAAEHGIDLARVSGTGLNGRVTKNDVLNFMQSGEASGTGVLTAPRSPAPQRRAGDQ
ncbi:MAG TPA: biotin/lipoyl-containing protein, partial [Anaerolineales bacterium]|nr:biotin/lipoyl-containing protein [Anaerolineales bacterium]